MHVNCTEKRALVKGSDGTHLYARLWAPEVKNPQILPTVFLCDGILCDGYIWKYIIPFLSSKVRVVHWHYRGHGRSENPSVCGHTTIANHASDLLSVVEAFQLPNASKPVWIGHSMGCQVILEAYRLAPEMPEALVLCFGSSGKITHTFHGSSVLAKILPRIGGKVAQYPSIARALWSRIPSEWAYRLAVLTREIDGRAVSREDLLPYLHHMTHVDPPIFLQMLEAAGEHSAGGMLKTIRCPCLVLSGSRDTFTPSHLAKQMADSIAGSEYVELEWASHAGLVERPKTIEPILHSFLTRAGILS